MIGAVTLVTGELLIGVTRARVRGYTEEASQVSRDARLGPTKSSVFFCFACFHRWRKSPTARNGNHGNCDGEHRLYTAVPNNARQTINCAEMDFFLDVDYLYKTVEK
jgi:hypothetical protein